MSTETIERPVAPPPRLDFTDPADMPPLNVIKCQCNQSCMLSGPCDKEAEGDDLLCDPCRKAKKRLDDYRAGLFSALTTPLGQVYLRRSLEHCHQCDPEFNEEGENNADRYSN